MQQYLFKDNKISTGLNSNIHFISIDDTDSLTKLNINKRLISDLNQTNNKTSFDFYQEYYFGNLILNKSIIKTNMDLYFIFKQDNLIFLYEKEFDFNLLIDIINLELEKYLTSYQHPLFIILIILNEIIKSESILAHSIQKKIDKIENALISDHQMEGYNIKILNIRKQLTKFKTSNSNINEFIDNLNAREKEFQDFNQFIHLIDNKSLRLNHELDHMIDHTLQIKEIYQNQLDINLNDTMNLFTVLSAIFLPLNLIVGWYGMNFKSMKEFEWKYGYFMVIIIIITTVSFILYKIKRNKYIKITQK